MLWPRLAFGCREKAEPLLHSSWRLIDRGGASRLLLQAGPRRGGLPRCRTDPAGPRRLLDQPAQRRPTARLFGGNLGCEKVISLITGCFRIRKAARRHEFRQNLELIQQSIVKLTPALVSGKLLVPLSGYLQRVPANNHCPRPFRLTE